MKKIAFFVNSLIKAGPVNVVYDIVFHLDRKAYAPIIFVLRNNVEYRSVLDKFTELNVKVIFLNFSFVKMELNPLKCAKIIENKLQEENINIVHSHSYNSAIILSKCSNSIRKVVTFHNICNEDFPRQKGLLLGHYMSYRYIRHIKKFDAKIGISKIVSEFYTRKTHDSSIITIYNGVDCSKFKVFSVEERIKNREKFGITNQTVYLILGTVSKLKNVLHVINAIKKLNDDSKLFYIVGTGPLLKKCKKVASGCKNIIFTGYQMNVSDYLSIADFSIAASKSEGFGLAALESIMTGLTLIYSDCLAFKELFADNHVLNKYMFCLKDKKSLLEKIKTSDKMTESEQAELIKFYKQKFDSRIMSQEYQKIYKGF